MDLELAGLKGVVTGAGRGIGRAIAEVLAGEGVDLAICDRNEHGLAQTTNELQMYDVKAYGEVVDVSQGPALKAFILHAAEALGGIDLFVHNTSVFGGPGEEGWQKVFEVDVLGAVRAVEAALPYLERSQAASIVFLGTTAAVESFGAPGPYGPLKAALLAYTNDLGQALGPKGIRVNAVSPGAIYFEGGVWQRVQSTSPEQYESVLQRNPLGRFGRPEEVARVVAFLASPAGSWVNGTHVIVDGGQHKGVD